MLRLATTQPVLRVVADQRGAPTAATDIAAALARIVARIAAGEARWGTYHFTAEGVVSWHGFAEAIFELAAPWRGTAPVVTKISTAESPTPARRPANSVLDCTRIAEVYGIVPHPGGLPCERSWLSCSQKRLMALAGRDDERANDARGFCRASRRSSAAP